jgi:hypothetical protein
VPDFAERGFQAGGRELHLNDLIMGSLYFFNLPLLMQKHGVRAFIETGTGYGFGVYEAQRHPFEIIVSIEIMAAEVERLKPAFAGDPRVNLFAGPSAEVLRQVLPQIPMPIVFWLDAHFPGAHHKDMSYDAVQENEMRLPLQSELQVIKDLRGDRRDVILIDDLRIYERDNFEWGNMSDAGLEHVAQYDSNFLYSIFQDTHEAQRFLNHSGYLALLPK